MSLLSRRNLLLSAAAIAGLAACSKAATPPAAKAMTPNGWPIGVQLFTVKSELAADAPGTLKTLKATGIDVIETAGTNGTTAAILKQQIEDAGLVIRSAHTNMAKLLDSLEQEIADAKTFGAEWLVCSSPKPAKPLPGKGDWVVEMSQAMTADAWKANAAHLAEMAPKVIAAGLKFAYHNHPMEFKDLGGGVTGFDLLAQSSADLRLELDIGWVHVAGLDALALLKKYAGRVDLLHVKDMKKDPTSPTGYWSTEVGHGEIDWKAVFAAAKDAGVSGYFVEQEAPYTRPVFESLADSVAYLHGLAA